MTAQIAFTNVLMTLFYIIPGYALCKFKKASADHLSTLSAILIYFCAPCMVINNFLSLEYSLDKLIDMGLFFVVTFILQALFMLGIFLIFKKRFHESKYRMLSLASVMGNVGFFGLPIVKALLPYSPEAWCYSSVYLLSMNVLVFTVGVYCLTGKKESMTIKAAIINPSILALLFSLPLYIFGAGNYVPTLISKALTLLSDMTTPLCMMILGMRLAKTPLKTLFCRPFVYGICLCKLLLYPLFCWALTCFLPVSTAFKSALLILSAAPCASIILNMAEMHRSETENAANCVMLSTLICFMTIPIMTMLI